MGVRPSFPPGIDVMHAESRLTKQEWNNRMTGMCKRLVCTSARLDALRPAGIPGRGAHNPQGAPCTRLACSDQNVHAPVHAAYVCTRRATSHVTRPKSITHPTTLAGPAEGPMLPSQPPCRIAGVPWSPTHRLSRIVCMHTRQTCTPAPRGSYAHT
jgi:hypothetical protein